LLLGEFDSALYDLTYLESLIGTVDKSEIEEAFYQKVLAKVYIKSYAIYGIKNDFKKSLEFFEKIRNCKFFFDQKMLEKINKDQQMLENRLKVEADKQAADESLKKGELREAEKKYLKILEAQPENIINQNEKVLSNLSLIYLNLEEYEKCILFCNDILKIIKNFKEKIAFSKYDNTFHIKILLRRAKSYEKTGDIAKAQADIEAAEKLEIRNPDIYSDINVIKNDLKTKILEKYKVTANKLLEQGQFSDALEYYDKSISLAKFLPKIEGLKLFLNRCSCLIKLGQFENSESECSRILSQLAKQKNIAIINSNIDVLEKIKQLEFLTLVKRAFVHTQQKKVFEAIQDYSAALEIKPEDKKIKENLNLLKASV
jgi:tetratricopeptide (TPR) repeat protein